MAIEGKRCATQLLLSKHGSFCSLEDGEKNQTKLPPTELCHWEKTRLDSICVAFRRVPNFLNVLVPYRYTKKYWLEEGTVVKLVYQPRPIRSLRYSTRRRSMHRSDRDRYCWTFGQTVHRHARLQEATKSSCRKASNLCGSSPDCAAVRRRTQSSAQLSALKTGWAAPGHSGIHNGNGRTAFTVYSSRT